MGDARHGGGGNMAFFGDLFIGKLILVQKLGDLPAGGDVFQFRQGQKVAEKSSRFVAVFQF